MQSIYFNEATNKIAENQEQFNTLVSQWNPDEGSVNVCFELTNREIDQLIKTKKLWFKQVTQGKPMNPILISPFKEDVIHERKEIKTINDIDTTTDEGKLFLSALAMLSTELETNKTPDEIINQIKKLKDNINF